MRRLSILLIIWLLLFTVSAQESACPSMQDEALENIVAHCADQAPGTLCFGHDTVTPVSRQPAEDRGSLLQPGDTISIAGIDWLSVSTEEKTWGTARALFPAYPHDGPETRTVALLPIGNVALFIPEPVELPSPLAEIKVVAAQGANLRALPNTEARVVAQITVSSDLLAIGRSPGGGWLLVYATPDLRGWISASVVTEAPENLPEMQTDADTVPLWLPWQSFDFRSGIDDAPCEGASASGILLQAPKFISLRRFEINGARVLLRGTAWLQATVSSGMLIHVIDGLARVSAHDSEVVVNSGKLTAVALEMDDAGSIMPAEPPATPVAYDYHQLVGLPIHALFYPSRVGLDIYTVAEPVPDGGGSPLEFLTDADACTISARLAGANIRSQPDPEAPVIAVMAYRQSAEPVSRGIGADHLPWWKLADSIWVHIDATASGGNCNAVPLILSDS